MVGCRLVLLCDFRIMREQRAVGAAPNAFPIDAAGRRLGEQSWRKQDEVDLVGCGAILVSAGASLVVEPGQRRNFFKVRALDQRIQGIAVWRIIHVSDHRDEWVLDNDCLVDVGDAGGLALALGVGFRRNTIALAFQVIDQNDQRIAVLGLDFILCAIAAEDEALIVAIVDVAADRDDLEIFLGQYADVDAAVVVAVDQHEVLIGRRVDRRQHARRKAQQSGAAFRLDHAENVGVKFGDDTSGVAGRGFIDFDARQFDPTDPVVAPVGNDLDRLRFRPLDQMAAVLPQDGICFRPIFRGRVA